MKLKIVTIADTHLLTDNLVMPEGDILIHAGDLTNSGSVRQIVEANSWLLSVMDNYEHVLYTPGNHDRMFEKDRLHACSLLSPSITYLEDKMIELYGLKIYGSPWQPAFGHWSFNLQSWADAQKKWDQIPEETDILITHGPPWKILDDTECGDNAGCFHLRERIRQIPNIKAHIFGHIHEGYGHIKDRDKLFVNASLCDARYDPVNKPIVLTVDTDTKEIVDVTT